MMAPWRLWLGLLSWKAKAKPSGHGFLVSNIFRIITNMSHPTPSHQFQRHNMSQLQPQPRQQQQQQHNNDHNSHPHLITHQHPRLQGDKHNGWHDGRDRKKAQDMSLDVSWAIGTCFFKFTILFTVANGYFY